MTFECRKGLAQADRPGTNVIGFSRRSTRQDSRWPGHTIRRNDHAVNVHARVSQHTANCFLSTRVLLDSPEPDELLSRRLDVIREITRHLAEGVCAFDKHSRIAFMNPAAEAALGWSESELQGLQMHQGRPFSGSVAPQQPARGCPLLRVLHCRETISIEDDFFIRQDGTQIPVSYKLSPITAGDQILGALLTFQDLSRSKVLEEELRQSQKLTAAGQLTASVAHDCGNLLTIVTGYADQILSDYPLDDPLRADIEQIHRAASLTASLTRKLRTAGRKQTSPSQHIAVALNPLVKDFSEMLRPVIGPGIDLQLSLAASLDPVRSHTGADAGELGQVLLNLAINARDAMPRGGTLTIKTAAACHPDLASGRYVLLTVSDTGCGMTEAARARVFEPFFTTKEPGKGTGLGLSIVHEIVKQYGGEICVESQPEEGATFKVYLPCVSETRNVVETRAAQIIPIKQAGGTILLADDNATIREMTGKILRKNGYHVMEAADGIDALSHYQSHGKRIDLLVTDLSMPNMSGWELARNLEILQPGMRTLFLSCHSADACDRIDFLPKPFTSRMLLDAVSAILTRQEKSAAFHA